jgi:hypothetical protein
VAQTKTKPKPVTVEQMPWARCGQCGRQIFYKAGKGAAAAALTEHYNAEHLAELASSSA